MKIKKSKQDVVIDVVIYTVMAIVVFATLYPFYLAMVLSLNEGLDAQSGGIYLWPRRFTLENYTSLFKDDAWLRAFFVTLGRTVLGTFLTVTFTAIVSYGLSHKELVFRKFYFGMFIFAMYFSGGVIPYYLTLKGLHLLNSFAVYIIPGCLSLFYVLVATSFFQDIPSELAESARLDGAGELTIFFKLVVPISMPLLATVAIFTSVGHWNSWYESAFFVQDKDLRTMAYLMMAVINQSSTKNLSGVSAQMAASNSATTTLSIQLAAMMVSVLPILCVYPFFQRYFVTGLTVGAVKS